VTVQAAACPAVTVSPLGPLSAKADGVPAWVDDASPSLAHVKRVRVLTEC